MTLDVTHNCAFILNIDKYLCILQSKYLQCIFVEACHPFQFSCFNLDTKTDARIAGGTKKLEFGVCFCYEIIHPLNENRASRSGY